MKNVKNLIWVLLLLSITLSSNTWAQLPNETNEEKAERMAWWTQDRFGLFIHWGLYAQPARHEWVKRYERLSNEQYEKYFEMLLSAIFLIRLYSLSNFFSELKS